MKPMLRGSLVMAASLAAAWIAGTASSAWKAWLPLAVLASAGWALQRGMVGRRVPPFAMLGVQAGRNIVAVAWILAGQAMMSDGRIFVRSALAAYLVLMMGEIWELATRGGNAAGT